MPQFRLGDTVEYIASHYGAGHKFTIIGIDTRSDASGAINEVLIGSKVIVPIAGLRFHHVSTIAILTTDRVSESYLDYCYCRWEDVKFLQHSTPKLFSRVSRRKLQKRWRDQIAQEIYKEIACRK